MYRIITTGIGQVHVGETAVAGYKMLHDTMVHSTSKHKSSPYTYSNGIKTTIRAMLSNNRRPCEKTANVAIFWLDHTSAQSTTEQTTFNFKSSAIYFSQE